MKNTDMETKKLIAIIGTADKYGCINSYAHIFGDTKAELRTKLRKFYSTTIWQQKADDIAVYPLITESNGYQHCGKELFRVKSNRFWAK